MKKTLIAAGIAAVVAAPAAFADVKITGTVEQAFALIENGNTTQSSDNDVTFTADEDLGNGLTAFAKVSIDMDSISTSVNGPGASKDQIVGVKGAFGTFITGRMEDFTRSKLSSKMTLMGAGGAGGDGTGSIEGRLGASSTTTYSSGRAGADRLNGAIAYVSPTMNGFHFGVAGYYDDATDVAVFYDNGPLSLAVSRETVKATTSALKDQDTTVMAASYSMGDIKATVLRSTVDNEGGVNGTDSTDMAYRLDYKMGNNTITLAYLDNEDAGTTQAARDDEEKSIWALEAVHNFSKRTAAYASYSSVDHATNTSDKDYLTVGISHKF
jgi:predicted porin